MCGWKSWCASPRQTCIVSFPRVASMPFGYYKYNSVCLRLPSPVLEVPKSKSSLVTFWESRYVAGTQPCSSAVLTNHQPVERESEQNSVNRSTANCCTCSQKASSKNGHFWANSGDQTSVIVILQIKHNRRIWIRSLFHDRGFGLCTYWMGKQIWGRMRKFTVATLGLWWIRKREVT